MFLVIFIGLVSVLNLEVNGLKCYEGSRGVVNGVPMSSFVVNRCDENMEYCFESYDSNLTEATASCQTMGTDPKLLDICKLDDKCKQRTDIDITICCCTTDLCNLQDELKPTPDTITGGDNVDTDNIELVMTNETLW